MTRTRSPSPPAKRTRNAPAPAQSARLVHATEADLCIVRRRVGRGFVYLDHAGKRVRDAATLERIRSLAIPPAYRNVRICRNPGGHLQAIGHDARKRKQYRYHPEWRRLRDRGKFARLREFGLQLPTLRRRLRRDLALPGLPRERALAVVVSLLAATLARVGNEEYMRENGSYGLTTLRARHLAFLHAGRVRLRFLGKSGQTQNIVVDDEKLSRLLRRMRELPGQPLFQYLDDDGKAQSIDSGMVNDYLHDAMGEDFTSKDFRTWGATLLAVHAFSRTPLPERRDERELARAIAPAVAQVAAVLGNTPKVCRDSYIHPDVFTAWRESRLGAAAAFTPRHSRAIEKFVLKLLRKPAPKRTRAR
jgi:DNA topoisomerase IB